MSIRKFATVLGTICYLCFATNSFAYGELRNISLAVYLYPVGAPQAFLSRNLNEPQGIDVDVIYELQRRLGFEFKENRIFPLHRDAALERLKTGHADLVGGGLSLTPARAEIYDFSPVYYSSGLTILFCPKHNPSIKTSKDVKGLRIGYESGSTGYEYLSELGAEGVAFDNLMMAYFMVARGEIDGLVYDKPPLEDFARKVPTAEVAITSDTFGNDLCKFAFAMTKDSPYRDVINKTLQDIIDDGTMQQILDKWGAKNE